MADRAAPEGGKPPSTEEIEVTPEMIEAGTQVRAEIDPFFESWDVIVTKIYRAMEEARRASLSAPRD